jgi:predicted ATPase/DNA-binding SARP family transcriptional activator
MNATPLVQLRLFGAPTAVFADTELALPLERRTQLAVLLACRTQWVPRAEAAAMLWPELERGLALANLRKSLFRMPSSTWLAAIESQGSALRLVVRTDVDDFQQALRERRLADAVSIHRGDLLAEFDDDRSEPWTRWLTRERDRLRAAWRGAALATLAEGAPEPAAAQALSARLLAADPFDEVALQHHMQALARDGQAAAARQAYRDFTERLVVEFGLAPGAELRALHDSLRSPSRRFDGALPDAPAARASASDDFIGRAVELRCIADLLGRGDCRLLCLVGPGGVGKTSLARRSLETLTQDFADGAAFIALEDVETPGQLGLRLAREAGVQGGPEDPDAWSRAMAAWRTHHVLLVLDNFEHLAAHAPLLDRLLQECPRLKLLVTSRVRLGIAGEWSMPVEGLPCPEAEDADRADAFDAVRVFVRAARRVAPGFAAAAEGAAIADICRQVEGLPLALEFAAAWVRVMPCSAIAEDLRRGTELLATADARRSPRHASMETVFEHSWQRLDAAERETLARLSALHGGFSIDTARAVPGASLPVLGALVDKSLLSRDGARLRLHPLVQRLAARRLHTVDHPLA